jgi:hypothetical protein
LASSEKKSSGQAHQSIQMTGFYESMTGPDLDAGGDDQADEKKKNL